MIEIEKPKIETVEISEAAKYGKFVVEPLERGYGNTLGNSLRRILLSSLPGAAVTSIQIDGVLHEFSTVEGVVEDVASIILHVKKLALKIYSDEEKVIEIDVKGDGTVTAADITQSKNKTNNHRKKQRPQTKNQRIAKRAQKHHRVNLKNRNQNATSKN